MAPTYEKLGIAKNELQNQYENNSFQDINDFEQYLLRSFDEFTLLLVQALSKINTDI